MAQRSKEIRGVFRYSANDITPDSLVIEVTNRGYGCSLVPINWATIYVCEDILDVVQTCKKVLLDLFACGVIDPDMWVENWADDERTEKSKKIHLTINRRLRILMNQAKIQEIKTHATNSWIPKRARAIAESFNCFDEIDDIKIMNNWVKQKEVQAWLFRFLESDDEEDGRAKRSLPDTLLIPGHQKLIAEAINAINRTTPWS
jgi:hypothetical protein